MGETAEELRREIETTRNDLGSTLDAIGDRVIPGRVIERQKNKMTGGVRTAVDRVMGKAHDAQSSVSGAGHGAADTVRDLPDSVRSQAQGTPLVAGALAFAVGFVIAAAIPPSDKEKAVSSQLLDKAEPMKAELTHVGQEIADHLKEPAMHAVDELKSTAQEGAQTVTQTAKESAADTKDQATGAVDTVKSQREGG
jgi:hypothetical protein